MVHLGPWATVAGPGVHNTLVNAVLSQVVDSLGVCVAITTVFCATTLMAL